MSIRKEMLAEIGAIIMDANTEILAKSPQVQLVDVKKYLQSHLQAGKILENSSLDRARWKAENEFLTGALIQWDSNRSQAFYYSLYTISSAQFPRAEETIIAAAYCSIALAEDPLIPSQNPEVYSYLTRRALEALGESPKKPELMLLLLPYAHGIFYNAKRFCPQLFKSVTPESVKFEKAEFLQRLGKLQDGSALVH
ncbi:TPA: hypothetical protein DIV55_02310 [Patescibacteria group bacterium]|uniref:Uncharacterized protein n=1 Tax=Candidatus Gottesmanbacteria bacterium GW2011_GWA1_43_11 TaxID=1618436 RepID=A0A0G1F904_9BACT|nr:MAG: hypothetical protein UV59_C0042G0010 [Candidatus Gottesmanbacteria bacterium GW2011_GWA1_43_11]HCS78555.1 hypothetical protein [Patescibacteria group bacterium]